MLIKRVKGYFKLLLELNISKTVYFNFKVFPWKTAVKFPVYFFGKVKFASLKGRVFLDVDNVTRGMVQFGCKEENLLATNEPTRLAINGELIFKGKNIFAHAVQLFIWNKGVLTIGNNSWVGSFTKVVTFRSITIGNNFLASWECQLFDTDFHFIENIETSSIKDPNGKIIIGDNVWVGSRSTILKNTNIPDNCIIALGSICNKNYSSICPPSSVIGGVPAKFIKGGVKYINNKNIENKLFIHFEQEANFDKTINRDQFNN